MKTFTLRVAALATLFALVALVPALAQESSNDALIQQLASAPRARWDAILEENRPALGDTLVKAALRKAAEALNNGDMPLCGTYAAIADEIDYVAGGKKAYLGRCQFDLGRYLVFKAKNLEAALSVSADMLRAHPDCVYGLVLAGRVHTTQRQLDKAIAELTQAVKLDPSSEAARMTLAEAYLYSGDTKSSLAQFQEVLRINPKNGYALDAVASLTGKTQARGTKSAEAAKHFDAAEAHFAARRYKEAAAEYELALQADPGYSSAAVYKGDSLLQLGDEPGAIACYRKAIEIDPKNRQAWRFLGDVLEKQYDRNGDVALLDEAITCFENALKADPSYATAKDDLERAKGKKAQLAPK